MLVYWRTLEIQYIAKDEADAVNRLIETKYSNRGTKYFTMFDEAEEYFDDLILDEPKEYGTKTLFHMARLDEITTNGTDKIENIALKIKGFKSILTVEEPPFDVE